jgi:hypothetical protein
MRLVTFILLLVPAIARGQIIVPAETKDRHPIVAKINTVIPEGAEIRGPGWIPPDAAKVRVLPTDSATLHIWADPGTYTLRYKIMWVSFRARTFKDGDGNEITINEYIGSDYVEESAEFRVLGTVDPPDPPDPPDPNINGPYEIMMFWNKNTGHSLQQAAVLRGQELRDQLRARGHIFLEVIEAGQMAGAPPEFKPFVDAAQGRAMPLVVFREKGGTKLIAVTLPETPEAFLKLVENPNLRKAVM